MLEFLKLASKLRLPSEKDLLAKAKKQDFQNLELALASKKTNF
jgi:stearoyl-CoA desaturase (delta-9 desaturase)